MAIKGARSSKGSYSPKSLRLLYSEDPWTNPILQETVQWGEVTPTTLVHEAVPELLQQ